MHEEKIRVQINIENQNKLQIKKNSRKVSPVWNMK